MFSRYLLRFCLVAIATILAAAQKVVPGSSLYASKLNQTWSSPSNTFFLGFFQTSSRSSSYVASISYKGGVPVWTAGGVSDAVVDSGGAFHFLRDGSLQLVNGSGVILWDSNTANRGVNYALLDDSGELTLGNSSAAVWSSFQNLTDTLVQSQRFTQNHVLRSGFYSFRLLGSGNLTLTWNDTVMYWNDSNPLNLTNPTLILLPNGILSLSDSSLNRVVNVAYSNDYGEGNDVFRFLRLDNNGNARMYSYNRDSGDVTSRWAALADQCQVYGYCGDMGVCSYVDSTPVCGCPSENFVPLDVNDRRKGCKRKVELEDCAESVTMLELQKTEFLTFQTGERFLLGLTACRLNCLASPSCVASSSLSDGTGYCYMKTLGLVSGFQSPVVLSTSYVKVCGPVEPNSSPSMQMAWKNRWRSLVWIFGGVITTLLLFLIALVSCFWWSYSKNRTNGGGIWGQYTLLDYASGAPIQFSYKELHCSTKSFMEKIGSGGFGVVYRGVLMNGMVVAVKQLEGIQQGERQFRMEVATISGTHHLNLVRLIGFCAEGRHRLLVYEFMKNGSLDHFLFAAEEQSAGKSLNWADRFKIALGTARGLTYLHEECRDCIVHCDIKPENILLDEHYNAKVSDFGLAKLINPNDPRYKSLVDVRGTRGYLAPEWLANLRITSKTDVYSFGMVLLEIVSGRRNFLVSAETNQKKFSEWAYEEFEKGNVEAVIDKSLRDHYGNMEQVMRAIQVSFWCIQEHPSHRPRMGKVVQMLEGVVEILRPPPPKVTVEYSGGETSAPIPYSSSSFQAASILTSSGRLRNMEKASSSLLESHRIESFHDHNF